MFKFREVRTSEKITDNVIQEESKGYEKIKPETDMDLKEAIGFINSLFGKVGD